MKTREEIEEVISAFVIDARAQQWYAQKFSEGVERSMLDLAAVRSAVVAGALQWALGDSQVGAPEMRKMFDRELSQIVCDFDQAAATVRDGGNGP